MTKHQPPTDKPIVCTCEHCDDDIHEGDKFWDTDEGALCAPCIQEMDSRDILSFFGYSPKTASVY